MGITQKAYYANMARLYSQSSWFSKSKTVKVKITQSCPTNSLRPRGLYTVQGTLQARILEWVVFPFFREIFPTQEMNPSLQADSLPAEPQEKFSWPFWISELPKVMLMLILLGPPTEHRHPVSHIMFRRDENILPPTATSLHPPKTV